MPSWSVESIRRLYPRAYEKWTPEDELLLAHGSMQGIPFETLAAQLQRQPSAIASRLQRLNLLSGDKESREGMLDVQVLFAWEPVYREPQEDYVFPASITTYMRREYGNPSIYRWLLDSPVEGDQPLVYIGETARLCPDRLVGYITLGPTQQTNRRLHDLFHENLVQGRRARMERLRLRGAFVNDLNLVEGDMRQQDLRRLLERLLVTMYRNQRANLLNL